MKTQNIAAKNLKPVPAAAYFECYMTEMKDWGS